MECEVHAGHKPPPKITTQKGGGLGLTVVQAWRTSTATTIAHPPTNDIIDAKRFKILYQLGYQLLVLHPNDLGAWQTMVKNATPDLTLIQTRMMNWV